jgi:hypothetical protein
MSKRGSWSSKMLQDLNRSAFISPQLRSCMCTHMCIHMYMYIRCTRDPLTWSLYCWHFSIRSCSFSSGLHFSGSSSCLHSGSWSLCMWWNIEKLKTKLTNCYLNCSAEILQCHDNNYPHCKRLTDL